MIFNSFLFLLVFLPVLLAGWFGLNHIHKPRAAQVFLIGMSLWFYGTFSLKFAGILLLGLAVNYGINAAVRACFRRRKAAEIRTLLRGLMVTGIVLDLGLLCLYKYAAPGVSALWGIELVMPVGLSFLTFSEISFVVDLCCGKQEPVGFLDFATYITYFPKLVEGPITFYPEIMDQFADPDRRKFKPEHFLRGICLLTFGMAKKLLLADPLSGVADYCFSGAYYLDTLSVILAASAYAFQLYFDFSGFMDMASGVSEMLNIELPPNFDSPYRATDFSSFWKRWHRTLTRFFTRYVYIPLGGNRGGTLRTQRNVLVIFLLSALWHGFGWTYLLWGVLSGLLVAGYNVLLRGRIKDDGGPVRTFFLRILVFALFAFTLLFFGAPSVFVSMALVRRLFVPRFPGWIFAVAGKLSMDEFYLVNKIISMMAPALQDAAALSELLVLLTVCAILAVSRRNAAKLAHTMFLSRRNGIFTGLLFFYCLISMTGVSTFLYFRF